METGTLSEETIEEALAELEAFILSEEFNHLTEAQFEELQEIVGKLVAAYKKYKHKKEVAGMSPQQIMMRAKWRAAEKKGVVAKGPGKKRGALAVGGAAPSRLGLAGRQSTRAQRPM